MAYVDASRFAARQPREKKRHTLSESSAATRQQEQRRIALELHDGLGQELCAASLLLRATLHRVAVHGEPISRELAEINTILDGAIALCRTTVRGLIDSALSGSALEPALATLAQRGARIYGTTIDVRIQAGAARSLSARHARELFLVAQEALRNAGQHAAASLVILRLFRVERRIYLEVIDDGSGLRRLRSGHKGMGIKIMRYRARQIGASLAVRKATPRGTLVRCVL